MDKTIQSILLATIIGTVARYFMLRRDYRQYPSYPHGVITHLALGLIAAFLGSVAFPALLEKEFTAVTFLALAATQFREVRDMERTLLNSLEQSELVKRGPDYIEGIARAFEARNSLVMLISFLVAIITYYTNIGIGVAAGFLLTLASNKLRKGKEIGQIAKVRQGRLYFEGANLFVDGIHFMNLATKEIREQVLKRGIGIVIEPFDDDARAILANNGQRLAIAHDCASLLGVYRDVDTAEFTPILRRDLDTGRVGFIMLPLEKDTQMLIEAIKRVPVLESAISSPLKNYIGRKAAD
ncbi:MAG: hypothetical protein GX767_08680 [Firmicutes bacterium]|nr:hypothetical protein [Bacillota bacterium]